MSISEARISLDEETGARNSLRVSGKPQALAGGESRKVREVSRLDHDVGAGGFHLYGRGALNILRAGQVHS
jgi:hypothetical protein